LYGLSKVNVRKRDRFY